VSQILLSGIEGKRQAKRIFLRVSEIHFRIPIPFAV
jgi:hypothetical protein